MRLKDKVAIVTGGSQGIGEVICYALAREGASVAVVNREHLERGRAVADRIKSEGGEARSYRCDVSQRKDCRALITDVLNDFGDLHILVNNAGIFEPNAIEDISEEQWDRIIDVNLKGSFLMAQAVVPHMKERGYGKIILIGSIASTHAFPMSVPYCASKGGVLMIAKALSLDVAQHGINVNCVSPGNTATPLNAQLREDQEFVDRMASLTPTGRSYLEPGDISGAVVFLASDEAKAVHGIDVLVDDGWAVM
jgi:NAD(P)-dependent dehydrogenase (short-subunit alcohol dehydrogenase family)